MDISDIDFANNLEYYTKDLLDLYTAIQILPSQDIIFLLLIQKMQMHVFPILASSILVQALTIKVPPAEVFWI